MVWTCPNWAWKPTLSSRKADTLPVSFSILARAFAPGFFVGRVDQDPPYVVCAILSRLWDFYAPMLRI